MGFPESGEFIAFEANGMIMPYYAGPHRNFRRDELLKKTQGSVKIETVGVIVRRFGAGTASIVRGI